MKNTFIILGRIILISYVGLCLVLLIFQRKFIYFPTSTRDSRSRDLYLSVDGARVQVFLREAVGSRAIIYFGGNAENVSTTIQMYAKVFRDHSLYFMGYRGYGNSSGSPSESALHSDARALFEFVKAKHPKITVVGRSLGTGIAVRLGSEYPIYRLVLITPYDSIQNLAKLQFPFMPVQLILRDKFESWRYAPAVNSPTLIIAAGNDEVIPSWSTAAVFTAFRPGTARMVTIPRAGHNSISETDAFVTAIQQGVGN